MGQAGKRARATKQPKATKRRSDGATKGIPSRSYKKQPKADAALSSDGCTEPVRVAEVHAALGNLIGGSLYTGSSRGMVMVGLTAMEQLLELAKLGAKQKKAFDRLAESRAELERFADRVAAQKPFIIQSNKGNNGR